MSRRQLNKSHVLLTHSPTHSLTGFTLIELLMAATLFSILTMGVVVQLRGGMTAWRRTISAVDELQQVRAALDRVSKDLANAVILDPRLDALVQPVFSSDAIQVATIHTDWRGGARAQVISYAVDSQERVSTLIRRSETVQEAFADLPPRLEPILPGVTRLSLRYASLPEGGAMQWVWQGTWPNPTILPKLIEVTIEFSAGAGPRQIRQVLLLPTGSLRGSEPVG